MELEGKPFCAWDPVFGVDARFLLGALQQIGRHGLDSENQRIGIPDSACDWKRGEDFLAAIKSAKAEHRSRGNFGQVAQLVAEHGGPLLHLFAGERHSWTR